MELRQLRHFVAVVDTGNLSRAADRVAISQPALTRSIKNLEEYLGVELLERKPRGVVPTEAGVTLYHHAQVVLNECKRLKSDVREIERGVTGTVHVGIAAMFSAFVIDTVAVRVSTEHPRIAMAITEGFFEELVRELADGRIDVIFSNFPPVTVAADLKLEPLCSVTSTLVAGGKHPILRRKQIEKSELVALRWVIADQPHATDFLEKLFAADGLPAPRGVVRTNSLSLMAALLASGQFVSAMPEHLIARELDSGTMRRLPVAGGSVQRRAGLIYREMEHRRPAVEQFLEAVRKVCRELPSG
jgi:DNA-binding transcriptional LysR family regulator